MKGKSFIALCIGLIIVVGVMLALLIAKGMGASVPDVLIRILGTVVAISGPVILIVAARGYHAEKGTKKED